MSRSSRVTVRVALVLIIGSLVGPSLAPAGADTGAAAKALGWPVRSATSPEPGDWPRSHFDVGNTGFNPFESVLSPENVSSLVVKWSVATAGGAAPDPVVAGGLVYVAPADGIVRALDAATGALVWSYDTAGPMSGAAPDVADGVLYVGNELGSTFALDAQTGALVWSGTTAEWISDPLVVSGGFVLANVQNDIPGGRRWDNFMLDRSTGRRVWSKGTGASGPTANDNGLIYIGNPFACDLIALSHVDGKIVWLGHGPGDTELCYIGAPSLDGGRVVLGFGGGVSAYAASHGAQLWNTPTDGVYSPPALAYGNVYAAAYSGQVVALSQDTGVGLWSIHLPSDVEYASPAVANGVLYIGADDGFVRAIDAATGAILWKSPAASAPAIASPAVANGVLYAAADDGSVYAYGLP